MPRGQVGGVAKNGSHSSNFRIRRVSSSLRAGASLLCGMAFCTDALDEGAVALTSPGGMYSGQMVQDVPVEDISSLRRNPVLADVMAQLDYMEKRGSGLKKICNATKELETYKEGRDPVLTFGFPPPCKA